MGPVKNILLIRFDRIGDLILTLPTDQIDFFKDKKVHWLISKTNEFIIHNAKPRRDYLAIVAPKTFSDFRQLVKNIKSHNFDATVLFHAPWWLFFAVWSARIPMRIGPLSQWYSIFFLNRAIRQRRSQSLQSELKYNLCLLEHAFNLPPQNSNLLYLSIEAPQMKSDLPVCYAIIHAGMKGSARNWPQANYVDLAIKMKDDIAVVFTGTKEDEQWLKPIKEQLRDQHNIIFIDGLLNSEQLLSVLNKAQFVVAPSTGIAHLAASLGRPTYCLFSPVKVQSPTRWKPHGPKVSVFVPEVSCPGHFHCLLDKCEYFDCMKMIDPQQVFVLLKPLCGSKGV